MYELRVVWEKDGEKIYRFSTAAEARAFQYGITEEVAKNKNRILPQIIISKKAKSELNSNKREGFIAGLTSLLTALFTCVWWYVLTRSEILVEYCFIGVTTMLVSYLGFLLWWTIKKRQ